MTGSEYIHGIFYNDPDTYPPIVNSARLLAAAGWRVNLVCRYTGEEWNVSYPAEVTISRIGGPSSSSWREYGNFVRQSLRRPGDMPSVIVGHDMHGLLPARLLASRLRIPLVYHCHDFSDRQVHLQAGGRIVRAFEQRFARTADLVIVPDQDRGAVIKRALALKADPLVAANAPLARPQVTGDALRQALGARGRSFTRIVFRQGKVGPGHGIEATIRSMPFWTDPIWGFVVMGPGDSGYVGRLIELARDLGVDDRFVALPPVSYDSVPEFTVGADIGHALYEPIHVNNIHIATASNKIMEYMAAGLPLLVSGAPALGSLVERYGCGMVAEESSPEDIAGTVNSMLSSPHRLSLMSRAAEGAFDEEFCYPRQFAPALDAVRALADRSRKGIFGDDRPLNT